MKKHEIEEWIIDIDNTMSEQLDQLKMEVQFLKARLQELEDKPPPPDPFARTYGGYYDYSSQFQK